MLKNARNVLGSVGLLAGIAIALSGTAWSQAGGKKFEASPVDAIANERTIDGVKTAGTEVFDIPTTQVTTVFLVLCVLIYLTYFGLKKYINWSKKTSSNKRSVGVLDTIPLGGKRFVTVTRIYDKILVLGVGENNINVLAELTEDGLATAQNNKEGGAKEHFLDLINTLTRKGKPSKETAAAALTSGAGRSSLL